jgi:hypothetical protein
MATSESMALDPTGSVNALSLFRLVHSQNKVEDLYVEDIIDNIISEENDSGPQLVISPRHSKILPSKSDMMIDGVFNEEQAIDAQDQASAAAAAILSLNPRIVISARGLEVVPTDGATKGPRGSETSDYLKQIALDLRDI